MQLTYAYHCDSHNAINGMIHPNCLISMGANVSGVWGGPMETLWRSLDILEQNRVFIVARSRIYRTRPHFGAGLMPDFYNTVLLARTNLPVGGLLRLFKTIERCAGRRMRARWSARALDLDLLDYGGRTLNWPVLNRTGGPIVLPHPLMHERGFVLVPLEEVAPRWRHPVLGLAAGTLLRRRPELRRSIAPA
jgi:2-amino-4-hydroxy-6-hydroxymethyldihydropteridine diphosphokinase